MFWVYAIRSESGGIIYVGQTNDLAGRIRQHNDLEANRSVYTKRSAGPWRLVHQERFPTRREAGARRGFLKTGQGREWLRRLLRGGASLRAPGHHDHADHSIVITRIGDHDQPDR